MATTAENEVSAPTGEKSKSESPNGKPLATFQPVGRSKLVSFLTFIVDLN